MSVKNVAKRAGAAQRTDLDAKPADRFPVKVVHVIGDVSVGGAQMVLYRLVERSSRNRTGIRHGIVSLMQGGSLRSRILDAGIKVEELGLARGSVPVGGAFRLANAVRRQEPTIIQGWMYHGNLAATIANYLQSRPCPLIWGVHHCPRTLREKKFTTRLVIRTAAVLSRLSAAIVYCSQAAARRHEDLGYCADKTKLIPNGFDVEAFKPRAGAKARLVAELGLSQSTSIIAIVGRFHPDKDFANGMNAAALLRRAGREFHLVLVGPGVDAANPGLMALLHSAAMEECTTLLGQRSDVGELMAGFDVLCSCSASEAFPNVIGEAMASGVPCVATNVGDSGLIVGTTGIVVPPRNPQALAEGLSRLLALGPEERRQLGQAARGRIIKQFSLTDAVQQYEALYRRVSRRSEQPA